jgi:hypothetical protein
MNLIIHRSSSPLHKQVDRLEEGRVIKKVSYQEGD